MEYSERKRWLDLLVLIFRNKKQPSHLGFNKQCIFLSLRKFIKQMVCVKKNRSAHSKTTSCEAVSETYKRAREREGRGRGFVWTRGRNEHCFVRALREI